MADSNGSQDIDFTVDKENLYREESITDLKVASIRQLVPIKADGSADGSRTPIFMGHTQLMTPEGPLPVQSRLKANNLDEAFEEFPGAMQTALAEMMERLQEMQRQQTQTQKQDDSRIIIPGR